MQMVEAETDTPGLRAQKLALRELLRSSLAEHKAEIILEEWSRAEMTIAHQLACQSEPALLRQDIGMTDEKRKEKGIFDALRGRPRYPDLDDMQDGMPTLIELRVAADEVLEDYFVIRILGASGGDRNALVLLGKGHVTKVAERLRAMGHVVGVRP